MFKISIESSEIDNLPLGAFPGEIKVIDKPGLEYDKAIFYLCRQKLLGATYFAMSAIRNLK